jgi:Pyruvate formate lyase-like
MARFEEMMGWLAKTYVDALNVIHYMHDKYAYERLETALHDYAVLRRHSCPRPGKSTRSARCSPRQGCTRSAEYNTTAVHNAGRRADEDAPAGVPFAVADRFHESKPTRLRGPVTLGRSGRNPKGAMAFASCDRGGAGRQ